MVDIRQIQSLNEVFTGVMRQIFLNPESSDPAHNDITWAQKKILFLIESQGPQKMSDIARQINVTMSGATAVVDKMVRASLVTRESDPEDRRVIRIALSPAGRSMMAECASTQARCLEQVLGKLDDAKRTELLESFERIHALLSEIQETTGDFEKTGTSISTESIGRK
jgi:DNA-binding MarR family transcriptional regulator